MNAPHAGLLLALFSAARIVTALAMPAMARRTGNTRIAPTPAAAPAYSGTAFFVGYLLAAVGPAAAGALRDATGGFTAVFASLEVLGLATLAAALSQSSA